MPVTRPSFAILAVAVACYVSSLPGPLLFDDVNAIVDNPAVHSLSPGTIFLTLSWWGKHAAAYRPVTTLTFAVNYALHGLDPFGYHLVNVLLHGGVSLLVACLLFRVTGRKLVSLLAALLFATHPVHTEAVASVVGRAEELAAFFGLAAWLVLLGGAGHVARRSTVRVALTALLFLAGVLSKESAVGFLGAIVAADLIYRGDRPVQHVLSSAWPAWAVLTVTAAAALVLRTAVLGTLVPTTVGRLDNVLATASPLPRMMTALAVLARYVERLLWPFDLSADYSYAQITLVESAADPLFLTGAAIVIGSAALAAWGWRRNAAICFALALAATTFALVSNLVVPIGTIMAERLLYAPSIGFCLLLALAIEGLSHAVIAARTGALAVLLGLTVGCAYGIGSVSRNRVWGDRLRFFEAMVHDAPNSARSHRELAMVYSDLGQAERARAELRIALRLDPDNPVTLYNLGNVELWAGRPDEAIGAYRESIEKDPRGIDTITNLGNAYSARGDEVSAELWFRRGLALAPQSGELQLDLANALLRQGKVGEAEKEYRVALERSPRDPLLMFNYGVCLETLGRFTEAVDQYRSALSGLPDTPGVMVRIVASLMASGHLAEALAQQQQAETRFPGDPRVLQARQLISASQAGGASGGR